MALTATYSLGMGWLQPVYNDEDARMIDVPLAPGTYARGTVIGQITASNVADVQTITITGSPTGSVMTLTNLPGGLSYTAVSNVTPAALATALNALLGASSVAITGTANASYVITFGGAYANQPISPLGVSAVFTAGTSPAIANVHTTTGVGPNGSFAAYASGNTDGSQTPRGILKYPCTVASTGAITFSAEIVGLTELVASMYYSGSFRTEELVGLDANAVTKLAGYLPIGTTTTGVFTF